MTVPLIFIAIVLLIVLPQLGVLIYAVGVVREFNAATSQECESDDAAVVRPTDRLATDRPVS